ncbi:MAG TPA: Crp/Fnr family transcriptional regulator [Candidatus Angelobacter sp.]|nr:Crp/Fnr family transcriptional regulator [Candidatus Angelobacter sp.]
MPQTSKKIDVVAALRRLPLFTDLSETELGLMAGNARLQSVAANAIIFSEGDECRDLLIVEEGQVRIFKIAGNGRQQLISTERAGSSLAEIAVFDGDTYPATAQALTATSLVAIDATHFREICIQHPQLALKVMKVLAHRLRRMATLVEDLSFVSVRGRLAAHLVRLAESGQRTADGYVFELTENNEELATRLGTVRELVSRNLGRLHNEGLIQICKRTVTVHNLDDLQAEISRSR